MNSRSMLQILGAFASYIDVPRVHLQDRSAVPGLKDAAGEGAVRIRSGKDKPESAFAAVRYRDYWFWIDQADRQTKRAMSAIVFFFTLADTGGNDKVPLITIPAQ